MWAEIFEFLTTVAAVICCSIAVKLADDFLDREIDYIAGKVNWAEILGQGTMLYAMFFLALAAGIRSELSLSLFVSSYIVGMFNSLHDQFPSRLNGFQESTLALMLGIMLFGWNIMLFSLNFVLAFQLLDDYIDAYSDRLSGQRNLANRFGRLECLVMGLICTLAALGINEQLFVATLTGTALVYLLLLHFEKVRA